MDRIEAFNMQVTKAVLCGLSALYISMDFCPSSLKTPEAICLPVHLTPWPEMAVMWNFHQVERSMQGGPAVPCISSGLLTFLIASQYLSGLPELCHVWMLSCRLTAS